MTNTANRLESPPQAATALQDRVWDTYLKGLLNYSFAPSETLSKPRVEVQMDTRPASEPEPAVPVAGTTLIPPPAWSAESFQCMFFSVGKMLLAAPLLSLREVVRHDPKQLRHLPGQPSYSKGVMDHRGEIIHLIDPGHLLMGDRYDQGELNYRYVILSDRPGVGFLCHEFVDMSRLDPDTINWYQNRNKRPWLAGIHRQRLCMVIDIDNLIPSSYFIPPHDQAEKIL